MIIIKPEVEEVSVVEIEEVEEVEDLEMIIDHTRSNMVKSNNIKRKENM